MLLAVSVARNFFDRCDIPKNKRWEVSKKLHLQKDLFLKKKFSLAF